MMAKHTDKTPAAHKRAHTMTFFPDAFIVDYYTWNVKFDKPMDMDERIKSLKLCDGCLKSNTDVVLSENNLPDYCKCKKCKAEAWSFHA